MSDYSHVSKTYPLLLSWLTLFFRVFYFKFLWCYLYSKKVSIFDFFYGGLFLYFAGKSSIFFILFSLFIVFAHSNQILFFCVLFFVQSCSSTLALLPLIYFVEILFLLNFSLILTSSIKKNCAEIWNLYIFSLISLILLHLFILFGRNFSHFFVFLATAKFYSPVNFIVYLSVYEKFSFEILAYFFSVFSVLCIKIIFVFEFFLSLKSTIFFFYFFCCFFCLLAVFPYNSSFFVFMVSSAVNNAFFIVMVFLEKNLSAFLFFYGTVYGATNFFWLLLFSQYFVQLNSGFTSTSKNFFSNNFFSYFLLFMESNYSLPFCSAFL